MIELPKRARPATNADINIVPYIDVMLVLLVIFMMTTPIIEQGVEVDLPEAPATMVEYEDQQPTVITIDKDGNYYINSMMDPGIEDPGNTKMVSLNVVVNQVLARREIWPDMQVFVRGDVDADYGTVLGVIAELEYKGIEKLGFMTQNPN
jgi:biopolymer transport protein TolR